MRCSITVIYSVALLCGCAGQSKARVLESLGIGGYSGLNIPVVQDDSGIGGVLGIRGRIGVPGFVLEPWVSLLSSNGTNRVVTEDATVEFGSSKISHCSLNIMSGTPFVHGSAFYWTGGIGLSWIETARGVEDAVTTYNVGIGIEAAAGPVTLDLSPRLLIINVSENTSRKNAVILLGANYYFY